MLVGGELREKGSNKPYRLIQRKVFVKQEKYNKDELLQRKKDIDYNQEKYNEIGLVSDDFLMFLKLYQFCVFLYRYVYVTVTFVYIVG